MFDGFLAVGNLVKYPFDQSKKIMPQYSVVLQHLFAFDSYTKANFLIKRRTSFH